MVIAATAKKIELLRRRCFSANPQTTKPIPASTSAGTYKNAVARNTPKFRLSASGLVAARTVKPIATGSHRSEGASAENFTRLGPSVEMHRARNASRYT